MEDLPLPGSQPTGSQRMKYGETAYRLRVIVDTISWATGLKPPYVILALILAFILAFGSAVTGTVLLLTSGRPAPLKPGDGAYGPVSGDEAAAETERAAAAAAAAEAGKTKRKDSTQFAGGGGSGGRGGTGPGGYAGASWAGMSAGGPVGGAGGGPYGSRKIPIYGGDRPAVEQEYGGRGETPPASKRGRTAKAEGAGGAGQRPELQKSQLSSWGGGGGGRSEAFVDGRPGQAAGAGGGEAGGSGGGEGPAGANGGGTGKGAPGQGLTPLPKVPDIGAGKAVRDADAKGRMPASSHDVPKAPGEDDGKDKDKGKKKGESTGEFKAAKDGAGDQSTKDGKAWDIYLDKSRAHDLPDGKGVHEPPQEARTIGVK